MGQPHGLGNAQPHFDLELKKKLKSKLKLSSLVENDTTADLIVMRSKAETKMNFYKMFFFKNMSQTQNIPKHTYKKLLLNKFLN